MSKKSVSVSQSYDKKTGFISTTTTTRGVSYGYWNLLFIILKYCFLLMLVIFIFRYALGRDGFNFTEFLNAIPKIGYNSEGVSYFESCVEALGVKDIFEFAQSDSVNLPIIGDLIDFFAQVIGIIVYLASAIVSSLAYFVDLVGLIF